MAKLWLTDRSYPLWGSLLRIIYWLGAIFLSSLYLQHYGDHNCFEFGLMIISLLFVIGFIFLARILDHLFKTPEV